jgi:hypothetical protein
MPYMPLEHRSKVMMLGASLLSPGSSTILKEAMLKPFSEVSDRRLVVATTSLVKVV